MDEPLSLTKAGRYRLEKYSTWDDERIHLPVDCVIVSSKWEYSRLTLTVLIPDPEDES